MSRITKQIAEEVAKKLVAPKKEKLKARNKEFSMNITELCLSRIPAEILDCYYENRSYFNTTHYFRPTGNGWQMQHLDLSEELPSPNGNSFSFEMDVKTSNALLKEFNRNKDQKEQIEELQRDLENILFNLRTYKAVTENFPEAAEHLPKIVNNSIALNLSDIRNRIK